MSRRNASARTAKQTPGLNFRKLKSAAAAAAVSEGRQGHSGGIYSINRRAASGENPAAVTLFTPSLTPESGARCFYFQTPPVVFKKRKKNIGCVTLNTCYKSRQETVSVFVNIVVPLRPLTYEISRSDPSPAGWHKWHREFIYSCLT